ncbi:hypothetical protein [Pseudosulfitobacter sp. SM2401]|uniref:hypothetical protein n=1 Tax=Pseudosulfitobacter sp. SM2401 TaxID=3350098 RepID=UPI0036F318D2
MLKFLSFTAVAVCLSTAAQACPWASGAYRASVPPDITATVRFNGDCSKADIEMSGGAAKTEKVTAGNKGWSATHGQFDFEFDAKGKRARVTRGGASRTVRMKKF